ncbi:MAG TPA: 50S ribosomal protein L11 methyltransferase, partial [Candidatus Scatomorpha stercoravium]|nr:50S ribosomal protein L11 methyltransferase [Candidatus Scatomorpha stercoravium]
MRWIEAAFRAPQGKLDALCDALTDLGAEGLVIEDEADFRRFLEENRQYWDYVDSELESRYAGVSRVKVYVEDSAAGRERLARWTEALGIEPETRTMADEDWENNWKRYYKPIPVGKGLLVLPKWEPEPEGNTRRVLKLDPGLAFGTGGHATTRMCLEFLEGLELDGARALDLGCGSGILGIGALILGCADCTGCDIDPKSPEAAADNAALNGIAPERYHMYVGDV